MPDKIFQFDGHNVTIHDPDGIQFSSPYIEEGYRHFFAMLPNGGVYAPQFDVDAITGGANPIDVIARAQHFGEEINEPSQKASNRARLKVQFHIRHFLEEFPQFFGLFNNVVTSAQISIRNAELLLGQQTNGNNFIQIKDIVDRVARTIWNREKDVSERQSGVSVLGEISETLLDTVLEPLIDGKNFFRVVSNDIKSYGDFVALCLPNNLWISVKSNFARERLLASGYSNDIVGAGFFVESAEFTNEVRIRNFQRAGFLAMYLPDVAVTDAQRTAGTSTYRETVDAYNAQGRPLPLNINGKPFIRRLSELPADIGNLLGVQQIAQRLTVRF